MTRVSETEGIDWQKRNHVANQMRSELLLRRLIRHHTPAGAAAIEIPVHDALRGIKVAVASYYETSIENIENPPSRAFSYMVPRWAFMHAARRSGRTYPEIASSLGLHHASIMHGYEKFSKMVAEDWTAAYDAAHIELVMAGEQVQSRPVSAVDADPNEIPTKDTRCISILLSTCERFGLTLDAFYGNARNGVVTKARRAVILELRDIGLTRLETSRVVKMNESSVAYWYNDRARQNKRDRIIAKARAKAQAKRCIQQAAP